jgi:hypothetical protein
MGKLDVSIIGCSMANALSLILFSFVTLENNIKETEIVEEGNKN